MTILCPTSLQCDYLQDQIVIGLRELHGQNAIDIPRKDVLYTNCTTPKGELYGRGFTMWCTLEDPEIDRDNMFDRAIEGEFNTIVFPSIWRTQEVFQKLKNCGVLDRSEIRVIIVDGEDHPRLFEDAIGIGTYYKRELRRRLSIPKGVKGISFSIPKSKLRYEPLPKTKTFATHAQCKEAYKIPEVRQQCRDGYAFTDESDYYEDIGSSEYAFTMKKCGWECMRHYEIAANQTVPCFYKLHSKPAHCAPHGLIDMKNVVAFNSARELQRKIDHIRENKLYPELQANTFAWACEHTCDRIAEKILA